MKLLGRLIKYVFPYKGSVLLIILNNFLYAVFSLFSITLVVPFLSVLFGQTAPVTEKPHFAFSSQSVIDTFYYYMGLVIEHNGVFFALIFIAVTMVVFSFLSNLFRYLAFFFLAPIRSGIVHGLRKDIYHQIVVLPLSFYSQNKKGDIMNRIGSDVQEVEWSIISTLQSICRDPFLIIIYLITLFSVSVKMTVFSLVLLPIVGYLIAIIGKSIKRNSSKAQKILGLLSSLYEETISGLRVIKGYSAIDHVSAKFKEENYYFYKITKKIYRINEIGSPLIEFLCIISMVIILIAEMVIFDENVMGGGLFVMYILVFARMISPAKSLATSYYTIQKGMASAERIYQIIDGDECIVEAENPLPIQELKKDIVYRNLFFSYEKNNADSLYVLNDINFSVKKGEMIALVGASGSGKSTIVDLLPRFYDVDKGELLIDGIDNKLYSIRDLRNLFGIVNQDVILFNDTVYHNIAFGMPDVNNEKVIAAAKVAQAHQFIMEMEEGYQTIIGDRGMRLSGGQRQRLSIARAILKNSPVLILDEATSSLDTESEFLFQQALNELIKDKTVIVVAHRLSTIRNASQILFVKNGRITERGTHDELMCQQGDYAGFCVAQLNT